MDIYDFDGSVRDDISETVEAISRYLESHPLPPNCFTFPIKSAGADNQESNSNGEQIEYGEKSKKAD